MASNKVDINVRIGMIVMTFCHQIFLVNELYAQHVPTMPMVKPDVEPAIMHNKFKQENDEFIGPSTYTRLVWLSMHLLDVSN